MKTQLLLAASLLTGSANVAAVGQPTSKGCAAIYEELLSSSVCSAQEKSCPDFLQILLGDQKELVAKAVACAYQGHKLPDAAD